MVVQPTGVAYSFLMECPIPSTKSETRNRDRKKQMKKKYTLKGNLHMLLGEGP